MSFYILKAKLFRKLRAVFLSLQRPENSFHIPFQPKLADLVTITSCGHCVLYSKCVWGIEQINPSCLERKTA